MEFKIAGQSLEDGARSRRPLTIATLEQASNRVIYSQYNLDFSEKSTYYSNGRSCNEKAIDPLGFKTSYS